MGKITEHISKQIDALDGNIYQYSKLAESNKNAYHSLNKYIYSRLREMNEETKLELAKRFGVNKGTFNDWEKNGITKEQDAFELAIALKMDDSKIEGFIQKGTGRGIYPADKKHFEYIFILNHREELEQKYPYEKDETVKQWIDRVKKELPITYEDSEYRKATEEFRAAARTGDIENVHSLPFRGAGEKAIRFLNDYIKDTPFESNYGNKNISDPACWNKRLEEQNVSVARNLFLTSEKEKFNDIYEDLTKGVIPHRYHMIELGMSLRMNCEQMNELLSLCGENPLYSRNIYEGALLTVWKFLSEVRPEWFEEKKSNLYVADLKRMQQKELMFAGEYEKEEKFGGPVDFCVLASIQVEKALNGLSKDIFSKELKERPSWYLNEKERKIRLEKRRLSTIISEMIGMMQTIRNRVHEEKRLFTINEEILEIWASKDVSIKIRYSLKNVIDWLHEDYGYKRIEEEIDTEIISMIDRINAEWMDAVRNKGILEADDDTFEGFKKELFKRMKNFYTNFFKN